MRSPLTRFRTAFRIAAVPACLAIAVLLWAPLSGLLSASAAVPHPASQPEIGEIKLKDPSGKPRTLAEFRSRKALALIFMGADCPISNGYSEMLSGINSRMAAAGVQVVGINANPGESLQAVAAQAKAYHLAFPVLKDEKQALADALGAHVTPEAFVLDATGAVRYRGRIDDGYASRGKQNARVASHDLEAALEAVVSGKPVTTPRTRPVGCTIVRRVHTAASGSLATFHKDVEPILQARCQTCHRPGQVAPFSLLTYADSAKWADDIRDLTSSRQMPPWLAAPGHGDFQDERRLSEKEIATLAAWAEAGAPEGSLKDAPPKRAWSDEWMLGKPDLVLTVSEAYTVPGTGEDEFRVFVLPTNLTEDRQLVAMDFRPGNPRVVHHLVSFVDTTGVGRKLDAEDPKPGYESGFGGTHVPGASINGVWAPGNLPRFFPPGVGRPLPKGSDILIQVHYHKTGKPETDRTRVALYFAKEPVKQTARTFLLGSFNIDIPPGAARHEISSTIKLPVAIRVLTIMPHMHLLGREMRVTATYPDGKKADLVWIPDWDYRWQDSYRYKEPLLLPKGTQLDITAYYDNTLANPRNPSDPPRRVRFGEQTTDEMAFAIMEVVPDLPERASSR